jgi:hypothetical protein
MIPPILVVGAVVGLTYLALRRPTDAAASRTGGPAGGGQIVPVEATADPVIGRPWNGTTTSVYLAGLPLPAVPLNRGGNLTGWYHPETHLLLAVTDLANHNQVVTLTADDDFPSRLPGS